MGELVEVVQQSSDLSLQAEHPLGKKVQDLFRCRAGESTIAMRKAAQVAMKASCTKGSNCSRKTAGAVIRIAFIWLMALVRLLEAESLLPLRSRIISTR